ncbi:FtsX-like permease family protein [Glycomyces harbinensis]|uniref:Putative ABC transport system permease protein n=1 Tax=Glycomyces harbinensis TaxID=58114 RepID=A0A1G6SWC1_9ACTN|nr:FtsX-like permease family protein [Glycomyces harbinensis]SDD21069.1 putative ABC transport system permease protein [Glycomyces harbinensis]
MFASHRLAFRIARREAMRYKGRSALSIALLGLPLLGVAIGATAYDTSQLSVAETAEQYLGENEAYIELALPGVPITQYDWDSQYFYWDSEGDEDAGRALTETEILAALPVGSRLAPYGPYSGSGEQVDVETPDGLGQIDTLGYNLADEAYEASGMEYVEGSMPGRGEVVISAAAADYLGLGVGDELVVDKGVGTDEHEVSGIVEFPWDLNGRFAIGAVFPGTAEGWLVDTPEPLTDDQALALNGLGIGVWSQAHIGNPPPLPPGAEDLSYSGSDEALTLIYGLIVVAVVMEVVLLAGPAFAISARRRTREFALMSATGATPAQIRNTVLAGGLLFGLLAALIAVALGIAVVALAMPLLEQFVGHRSAGLRVLPQLQGALVGVAVATGLLSALAAAISASRINVVAALMGRTPGRKGSKRWLVVGLAMVGAGIAAGLAGLSMWSLPLMAAAIILAQLGLVACTPALLALTARLGRWMPLSPRMAMREAGRNRGSAAPAIAAVLGVVAAGMCFSMVVTADAERNLEKQEQILSQDAMTLTLMNNTGEGVPDWEAALAETEPVLRAALPDLRLTYLPEYSGESACEALPVAEGEDPDCSWTLTRPEDNECSYWSADYDSEETERAAVEAAREDPRCDENIDSQWYSGGDFPVSTDPAIVQAYTELEGEELDEAVAVLEAGGVLTADEWSLTDQGTVVLQQEITIWDENGSSTEPQQTFVELPAFLVDKGQLGYQQLLLSPGAAEEMGMTESLWQRKYLIETSADTDSGLTEALTADLGQEVVDGAVWAQFEITDYRDPFTFYFVLAVTGLCALIALGATAVSTGLIIAEQRRDMTTLGAVGAPPGLRKRFAMWQTVMIALFGAGLGTVAGVIGYALIREALNRPLQYGYPFDTLYGWELPWAAIGITVLAVPLIAAVGALVFTRARLPSERRLT